MAKIIETEWIVEQYTPNGMRCIGKVLFENDRKFLSDDELESIWDACNWGVSQPEESVCEIEPYEGMTVLKSGSIVYLPLRQDVDVVNGDIFIRKHYDLDNGFYIHEDRRANKDEWMYGKREVFLREMKSNPYYSM